MNIAIDVVIAIALIFAGYVYVCNYFNNVKLYTVKLGVLKLTKNKVLYLVAAAITGGLIITLFQTVYYATAIHQAKLVALTMLLFPIAAIDNRVQKIPNHLLIAAMAVRIMLYAAEFVTDAPAAFETLKDNLLGAAVIGGFFLLMLLIFQNSIGMGDVKLFAVMGMYQGLWGTVNSVFFSLLASFVLSVALLLTRKKKRKDTISFGPCILLGVITAISLAGI